MCPNLWEPFSNKCGRRIITPLMLGRSDHRFGAGAPGEIRPVVHGMRLGGGMPAMLGTKPLPISI